MLLRSVPRLVAGLFVCLAVLLTGCSSADTKTDTSAGTRAATSASAPAWAAGMETVEEAGLPAEARRTLALIDRGGPFPYAKDGAVFGNFERELPRHERGYYREYTVRTPGERDRGARRIVTGQGGEVYYTDDHYKSFRAVLR
ncbi:ribonuclease domain-containing protein [Streptomyces albicerus]|uniref:ribonuclease domain-containing protein n=1 Tax=Streptomyces albicerus TaxID=2569859 RepID=UPI00124B1088|nr:ribonuclease domain-containing protein [Streptomyces albicerus]